MTKKTLPAVGRGTIRAAHLADETTVVKALIADNRLLPEDRARIGSRAASLVTSVRAHTAPTIMERFLVQYGLTTQEGIALMCLAEALLRVPDAATADALIEDKIRSGSWRAHWGRSDSRLINGATLALSLTARVLEPVREEDQGAIPRRLVRRLSVPVVRLAVTRVMKAMGRQFVLGRDIGEATRRARKYQERGYTYSYDMLGEAARTDHDARRYYRDYAEAIASLAPACVHRDIRRNPGISVKLSALHPRYEFSQAERLRDELVPRVLALAKQAKAANMGFNIDAEEADRLEPSLDVIEAVLSNASLAGWSGLGVAVQAFGKRAPHVIDWLYQLAGLLDRRIMVRLVKGAYWDTEIKRAQAMGLKEFPVFTRKVHSDVSYIVCARKLLSMTDRIYPQFATHNAHSIAAILELAGDHDDFELQRLHGMGESLHDALVDEGKVRSRIYAPVGPHRDLLAYLVRRLLENGANSSFVHQIADSRIEPGRISRDPFELVEATSASFSSSVIAPPATLFGDGRVNARGWDLTDPAEVNAVEAARLIFEHRRWRGGPMLAGDVRGDQLEAICNPARPADVVGEVIRASRDDIENAIAASRAGFGIWSAWPVEKRAACLRRVGDLYEENAEELFALAVREAGKNLPDAVAEVREAVDFARYYANEAVRNQTRGQGRGVIACISPWNFPLAIFTGQILAALAAGNAVIAKPAEQTPLIAVRAVELMHQAGVPRAALQLLPGGGATVGAALTCDARIDGVCFTGSTPTAGHINRAMAGAMAPDATLIAETGGLNAMIVDSTALPEQVVRDVLASSFQSAGQRCSALRMLYLQSDIADHVLKMLMGAMDELRIGDPWLLATDVGPVIDAVARKRIETHIEKFEKQGRVIKRLPVPGEGFFVGPTVIRLDGIHELEQEIFGPVLHVATFEADEIDQVIDRINGKGFGLTFGLHTRIDSRVDHIVSRIRAGNLYVNRNQIGAVVGSQPFGGEGLSGTGPKAGGPMYVRRLMTPGPGPAVGVAGAGNVNAEQLRQAIAKRAGGQWADVAERMRRLRRVFGSVPDALDAEPQELPGPTGELNVLRRFPRGRVLCLGPDWHSARQQAVMALSQGNIAVVVAPGAEAGLASANAAGIPVMAIDGLLESAALEVVNGFQAVVSSAPEAVLRQYRIALSRRDGALLPLLTGQDGVERYVIERHLCIDTTAAGGNASLIAASE